MKKIILKKQTARNIPIKGYKINYEHELNKAQYEAVMHNSGAALVIAGAGTGKTRTLIYRVSRLIEDGVAPNSILLLTFTRKAASEMIRRASTLLDSRVEKISGGTFHSFATMTLRKYSKSIGYASSFNILDQSDSEDVINLIRTEYVSGGLRKRFPKKNTLNRILSMSRNTQTPVIELIENDYPNYIEIAEDIENIFLQYANYKKRYNLMDYDDLLVNLLLLLKDKPTIRKEINSHYKYIMVDEYQDSNRLQHEIVLFLAGEKQNAMAVGDDAQSIYSFRGAHFENIINYPKSFSDCKIFKIEENYRSVAPILNFTNQIMKSALYKYDKELFTGKEEGELPKIISSQTERQQSLFLVQQILELHEEGIPLSDIAVIFRNSFHSFDLEIELEKSEIPYKKFGGLKFIETAHIKDLIAYVRVLYNPLDAVSWQRLLLLQEGIGPKSSASIIEQIVKGEVTLENQSKINLSKKFDHVSLLFKTLNNMNNSKISIGDKIATFAEHYKPLLDKKHDDSKKRWRDIETFMTIAEGYNSIQTFLNDMALDPPNQSVDELLPESKEVDFLNLTTIHSAKGLEWKAVFLIWTLEGRFPSAKSVENLDSLEEERRLFYVACTRAKDYLYLTYPTNIYDRESGFIMSEPSRFIREINDELAERYAISEEEDID